jgi:hypothetical protein
VLGGRGKQVFCSEAPFPFPIFQNGSPENEAEFRPNDCVFRIEFMACCEACTYRGHSTICVSGLRFVLEKCHSFYFQYRWLRLPALQKCSYHGYDVNHTLTTTAIFSVTNIKKHIVEDCVKWDDGCV